ncbi:MAG: hypothetical protein KDD44_05645 [Bdellovibrionales bacterium]|nr:hypothetical protein [Bdellovibrionales bacterium]
MLKFIQTLFAVLFLCTVALPGTAQAGEQEDLENNLHHATLRLIVAVKDLKAAERERDEIAGKLYYLQKKGKTAQMAEQEEALENAEAVVKQKTEAYATAKDLYKIAAAMLAKHLAAKEN